jgi:tRNA(Ile)-lysidine synthase
MTPLSAAPSADRDRLLAGLAAGLPRGGIWSAPAVVAVSGGADSTALLLGLVALAPAGARLIVAHAEHDLRTAAAVDRAFVAAIAARLGLECTVTRLAVRHRDAVGGEGLEARARRLRYRFLEDVARDHAARHVLVAHTADDQAETILHRILRGTGPAGLAGMSPARTLCEGVALLRPLLAVPREDVRAFLTAEAEAWREDESNGDVRHARNFLRHEILARCATGPYPAATAALVRLGGQVGRLAAALRSAAEHLLEIHARRHADGTVVLRTEGLVGLDPHLRAEVFVALWERQGWPRRDMTAGHYERLATMAVTSATAAAAAADFPGGVRVVAERAGAIVVVPPAQ